MVAIEKFNTPNGANVSVTVNNIIALLVRQSNHNNTDDDESYTNDSFIAITLLASVVDVTL